LACAIEHATPEELVQKNVGRKTRVTLKSQNTPGDYIHTLENIAVGPVGLLSITL